MSLDVLRDLENYGLKMVLNKIKYFKIVRDDLF